MLDYPFLYLVDESQNEQLVNLLQIVRLEVLKNEALTLHMSSGPPIHVREGAKEILGTLGRYSIFASGVPLPAMLDIEKERRRAAKVEPQDR